MILEYNIFYDFNPTMSNDWMSVKFGYASIYSVIASVRGFN